MLVWEIAPALQIVGVSLETNFGAGSVVFEDDVIEEGRKVFPYGARVKVVAYPVADGVMIGIPIIHAKIVAIKVIRHWLHTSLHDSKEIMQFAYERADELDDAPVVGVYLTKRIV